MYRYEPPAMRMPKSNLNCTEETKEKATKGEQKKKTGYPTPLGANKYAPVLGRF